MCHLLKVKENFFLGNLINAIACHAHFGCSKFLFSQYDWCDPIVWILQHLLFRVMARGATDFAGHMWTIELASATFRKTNLTNAQVLITYCFGDTNATFVLRVIQGAIFILGSYFLWITGSPPRKTPHTSPKTTNRYLKAVSKNFAAFILYVRVWWDTTGISKLVCNPVNCWSYLIPIRPVADLLPPTWTDHKRTSNWNDLVLENEEETNFGRQMQLMNRRS